MHTEWTKKAGTVLPEFDRLSLICPCCMAIGSLNVLQYKSTNH